MVLDFFEFKPKILEALVKNNSSQPQTYNNQSTLNPTGYYTMTGMGEWVHNHQSFRKLVLN